jgi:hypothetical protein
MLDLALLRDRAFVGITLLPVVLSVSYGALLVFLPLYFERVQGYDALGSGMALLPFTSPMLLLSPVGARLAQRDCQGTGTLQARSAWSRSAQPRWRWARAVATRAHGSASACCCQEPAPD